MAVATLPHFLYVAYLSQATPACLQLLAATSSMWVEMDHWLLWGSVMRARRSP